jgi:hypothetical protein
MNCFYVCIITLCIFQASQKICDKLDEIREPLMCVKSEEK